MVEELIFSSLDINDGKELTLNCVQTKNETQITNNKHPKSIKKTPNFTDIKFLIIIYNLL